MSRSLANTAKTQNFLEGFGDTLTTCFLSTTQSLASIERAVLLTPMLLVLSGGGGGLRTTETLSSLTVFKTAGFNRSPTTPFLILTYSATYRRFCDNGTIFFAAFWCIVTKLSPKSSRFSSFSTAARLESRELWA